ncbi:hypothetical protein P175DRAFT_0433286 [Aspergillus ochraceoroseus IBT 24754]|uniref:GPI anchored protein n=3 Tax=Aspergillus subgen. Nidulantes TaxID=2720870 RepID=A0A0F8WCI1_9EURO|nr:uncharacterized protein P175DRAFT_0433286 [Aspergillus ochraceoroseus IBT 24754]KKK15555.1 hypothetical protein ARAM_005309 [Aspergillus rambellii]KKK17054.1 hypothetical protein AOCH_004364 [Aspergillus ochraceoroseus]PTU22635.1 hypothetical protein P175DRAFT_0433286 [Aspergillus ochraceoroseus IBT 24754]
MRSGLQKPGAIPFLALIVFSLLSLVPSLAKEWEIYTFHLGYIGSSRHDDRQPFPRVKNSSTDIRSRLRLNGGHSKFSLFDGFYPSSYLDRTPSKPQSVIKAPPRSTFEVAPVLDDELIPYSVSESSSLTRGVSAFKAFVIKQWDDQQILQSFSTETEPFPDPIAISPTLTLTNSSVTLTPIDEEVPAVSPSNLDSIPPKQQAPMDPFSRRLRLQFRDSWQQVCRVGGCFGGAFASYFELLRHNRFLISGPSDSTLGTGEQLDPEDSVVEELPQLDKDLANGQLSNNSSAAQSNLPPETRNLLPTPTQPTQPTALLPTTAGQSKVGGFGSNSEHMRGSSMAIVIGLVAGIMWF